MRRIGVLWSTDENDPLMKASHSTFVQALAGLGWTDGRNVRIDLRSFDGGDINRVRALAQELVGLQPDIIMTVGSTPATVALQRETSTIPIVFAPLSDPVASGLVARLNQPGGNITGFASAEARNRPTERMKALETPHIVDFAARHFAAARKNMTPETPGNPTASARRQPEMSALKPRRPQPAQRDPT